VWASVLKLSSEQAGFSVEEIDRRCTELFGDDAPTRDTITDTVDAMVDWGVLDSFGFDSGATYYILTDDDIGP
jgi:hypothetical protein